MRAGSYNAARPQWRGVLRESSFPVARCVHEHEDQPSATECAREAAAALKAKPDVLPVGWINYDPDRR